MPQYEQRRGPKRIVLATIGSLGDLHPCLSLGTELKSRGHSVTVATTEFYRSKVQQSGLDFKPLRPDWDPTDSYLIGQCESLRRGPEILFRKLVLPHLRDTCDDLLAATAGADLMLAGELVYPAPLVSEKTALPWASIILSPSSFISAHDPSLLVTVPELYKLRRAGWVSNRLLLNLGRIATRHWWQPVRDLRLDQGLTPHADPVFKDKFSPHLVLALFSSFFAQPQPDWPPQTVQPGFVYRDQSTLPPELLKFLDAGEPPLIFTLGSTAVHYPGFFFAESLDAAKILKRRAILVGAPPDIDTGSSNILSVPYAPYSAVFPRAAAIIHQGGSGTTAEALRAGRPSLIVPFGWDQPDNAARIERLGVGLSLTRKAYSAQTAATALNKLLTTPSFATAAHVLGPKIRAEAGTHLACDAIETLLGKA